VSTKSDQAQYGNDRLTLIVAVPLLLTSSVAAERGSAGAFLLWAGAVGYAVYNYAFHLLGAALNAFFPLYVSCVVLAAVTLILTLPKLDAATMTLSARSAAPRLLISGSFVIIGFGLGVVWIAMWAAHVFAGHPTTVDPEAFRLVAALDLSMMVPALVSGGVLLWRRRPWGVVLAAIAGVQGSLYLAVLSLNSLVAIERGPATWPGELVIWGSLAVVTVAFVAHATGPRSKTARFWGWRKILGSMRPVEMSLDEMHRRIRHAKQRGFRCVLYFGDGVNSGDGLSQIHDPGKVLAWGGWIGPETSGRTCSARALGRRRTSSSCASVPNEPNDCCGIRR